VQSVESKIYPAETIQALIGTQLQELRSDILKFDEVSAEYRKSQDLNATLNDRLAAEREETQELNKKIDTLRDQEDELEQQKGRLECKLAELNGKIQDQDTGILGLQNGTEDLQRQLVSVEDDCSKAKAEIERLRKNIQKRDERIADYDVSCSHPPAGCSTNAKQASIQILKDENNRLVEKASREKVM
jgi:chromosome segregation ATPase